LAEGCKGYIPSNPSYTNVNDCQLFNSDLGPKYINNQQIPFNIYDVFYSKYSQQHVSAGIATIFMAILFLEEYKMVQM